MLENDQGYVLINRHMLTTGLQRDANSDQLRERLCMPIHRPDLNLIFHLTVLYLFWLWT